MSDQLVGKDKRRSVFLNIFFVIFSLLILVPFYMMFNMCTYDTNTLFKGLHLTPGNYLLKNLATVASANFHVFYINSFIVSTLLSILTIIVCSMCGFAITKYEFKGKSIITASVYAMMMIPPQLGIVAFIWEMRQLGWNNTYASLIVPFAANAFYVYWMKQYIVTGVPNEILESARIDGCSEFRLFFSIVLPFIKPAIASVGLLTFINSWNNYIYPLLLINKPEMFTVTLGLSSLGGLYRTDLGARITALAIGTVPMIILFTVFSKSLINGLAAGAVKG